MAAYASTVPEMPPHAQADDTAVSPRPGNDCSKRCCGHRRDWWARYCPMPAAPPEASDGTSTTSQGPKGPTSDDLPHCPDNEAKQPAANFGEQSRRYRGFPRFGPPEMRGNPGEGTPVEPGYYEGYGAFGRGGGSPHFHHGGHPPFHGHERAASGEGTTVGPGYDDPRGSMPFYGGYPPSRGGYPPFGSHGGYGYGGYGFHRGRGYFQSGPENRYIFREFDFY